MEIKDYEYQLSRLTEILDKLLVHSYSSSYIAEQLIKNNVRINEDVMNCGNCYYSVPAIFGKSHAYVRCTNEEHLQKYCRRRLADIRQPSQRACKLYKAKEI